MKKKKKITDIYTHVMAGEKKINENKKKIKIETEKNKERISMKRRIII